MSIDMSKFLDTFFEESAEGVDAMEAGLLNMQEGAVDNELINTIFRAAHSIKGGGATFGLTAVSAFTHNLETLLDEMRSDKRPVTTSSIDVMLESVDIIREMLAAAKSRSEHDEQRSKAVTAKLELQLQSGGSANVAKVAAPTIVAMAAAPSTGWRIQFAPKPHLFQTGNDPVRMLRELQTLGKYSVECNTSTLPAFSHLIPELCYLAWNISLEGDIAKKSIEDLFEWVDGDCELVISPLAGAPGSATSELGSVAATVSVATDVLPAQAVVVNLDERRAAAPAEAKTNPEASSIRVNIDKVDALINMVGELVITRSMLSQIGKDFDMRRIEKLLHGLEQLDRNTRELQESVMRIRMMPINFAFQRFPRMVRDLSQKLDKKIELKLSGEQTELDKTVMEKISDPLVHLVRNSVDHGIERPDVRLAAGKSETGVVHLNAFHQGGNIVIEISDDGAGLPKDKVLKKARERGLIPPDGVLSDDQIHDLIFMAGFSTADQISDVSGRGVGMDVVRRNIKALGGTVDVRSEPGKGSTFTIRLPLTLAIMDGQSVAVGEELYIVPLISVVISTQIKANEVSVIANRDEVYRFRNEYLPVIRLHEVLNVKQTTTDLTRGLFVIVEGDGRRAALFVDDLLGQQQVVIKSIETNYKRIEGLSGATILGDGSVALILDIPGLLRIAHQRKSA